MPDRDAVLWSLAGVMMVLGVASIGIEWAENRSLRARDNYLPWKRVHEAMRAKPNGFWIVKTGGRWSRVVWILPRSDPLAAFDRKTAVDMISGWIPGATVSLIPIAKVMTGEIESEGSFQQVNVSIKR